MIETSADLDKIAPALHAAQGQMTGVVKDARNPHFKNHYATLEAVIDTARPPLQAHGLSVTQAPAGIIDGSLTITTMLLHTSGQWIRSTLHVPLGQKRDAQAVGSAISYGRRYALMAVLGLPSVDDDGQAASTPAPRQEPAAQNFPPKPRVSAEGQEWIAEIGRCETAGDIEALKRTPEFRKAWAALSQDDRSAVQAAAEAHPAARVAA